MSFATIVVRSNSESDSEFVVGQRHHDQAEKLVRETVGIWNGYDKVTHTVLSVGRAMGQRITVHLAGDRRTVVGAVQTLKQLLENNGLDICPAKSRDYSEFDQLADVGLPIGKPAGDDA